MLIVVDFHRLRVDVRFERIVCIRQVRQSEWTGWSCGGSGGLRPKIGDGGESACGGRGKSETLQGMTACDRLGKVIHKRKRSFICQLIKLTVVRRNGILK